jgi:hypothetical protein
MNRDEGLMLPRRNILRAARKFGTFVVRIKVENFEQEQTETTEAIADSLFPLLSPVSLSVFRKKMKETKD